MTSNIDDMESIAKCFDSWKKTYLSDGSKASKEPKILKEITSVSSISDECDVFNDALDNADSRGILLNLLQNLMKEVKIIQSLVNQNWQMEIENVQLLADLSKSVEFITDKFDEYGK